MDNTLRPLLAQGDYILVYPYMVQQLRLRGNDLLVYALLQARTRAAEPQYVPYADMAAWAGLPRPQAAQVVVQRLVARGLVAKVPNGNSPTYCTTQAPPVGEQPLYIGAWVPNLLGLAANDLLVYAAVYGQCAAGGVWRGGDEALARRVGASADTVAAILAWLCGEATPRRKAKLAVPLLARERKPYPTTSNPNACIYVYHVCPAPIRAAARAQRATARTGDSAYAAQRAATDAAIAADAATAKLLRQIDRQYGRAVRAAKRTRDTNVQALLGNTPP